MKISFWWIYYTYLLYLLYWIYYTLRYLLDFSFVLNTYLLSISAEGDTVINKD